MSSALLSKVLASIKLFFNCLVWLDVDGILSFTREIFGKNPLQDNKIKLKASDFSFYCIIFLIQYHVKLNNKNLQ